MIFNEIILLKFLRSPFFITCEHCISFCLTSEPNILDVSKLILVTLKSLEYSITIKGIFTT